MKHNLLFRRFFALLLLSAVSVLSWAYDFVVGGIYYNRNSDGTSVTVAYKDYYNNSYSGSVAIPSSVTYNSRTYKVTRIGSDAFRNCYNLSSITIPSSVSSIDENGTFYGCSKLSSITVESGNTSYDSRDNCNAIIKTSSNTLILGCKNTTIPSSVTSIGYWAFSGNTSIVSILIPNNITKIDYNAFSGCSGLTSVQITDLEAWCKINFYNEGANPLSCAHHLLLNDVEITNLAIPDGATSIGAYAFYGGSNISSVSIPNSVTSIGSNAFSGTAWYDNQPDGVVYVGKVAYLYKGAMPEKTTISIKSGTLGITESAFKNCINLSSVNIPSSVTTIGASAFSGCSNLTSVNLPSNMTYLGSSAFYGCSKITAIVIPSGITSINDYSFYGCSSLESVTIGDNVSTIGRDAFENCINLNAIVIPNSVTEIGQAAFRGCSGLTSLSIGNSLTKIEYHVFENCGNLNKIVIGKGLEGVSSDAFKGCNNIATLEYHCKSANGSWFNCKESLSKLIIGDEVESVSSFNGCTKLVSVDIGNGLKTIGSSAFQGCGSLASISIGNGVEYIGNQSFQNCSSLTSISIPNSVKTLGSGAFSGCSNLVSVSIGSGLETVNGGLFGSCDKLVSIEVDENNPKYDSRNNCNAIIEKETNKLIIGCKGTTIPNSVASIGGYSFQACHGLASMDIPQGVTAIEPGAFYNCSDLANVSVPNGVTVVGDKAFYGTAWFDNQPDGLLYVGKVAYKYKGTVPEGTTINIKDGTVGISGYAFDGCSGLVSVTIPNSVTNIGEYAFCNCSGLLSIDIPEGVTSIGQFAFDGCSSLSSITFPGSLKTIDGRIFGYNYNGASTTSLKSVTVGEGVEKIGEVFNNLKNATITLPNSVTTILSFQGCQNCTVTIGTGIENLSEAFSYTTGMTIYIHAFNRPNTNYHCFYWATNCKSYVPYGRGDAYELGRSLNGAYYWCGNITEMPYPSLTIGSSGHTTYCSNKALDFSEVEDVKAYIATDYMASTNTLHLKRVMKIPAGEGIIVVGAPGTYDIPECTTDITYTNLLSGMNYPNYVEPTDGDYTNFLFTESNAEKSFHTMENTTPLFAGTAYLHLPSDCIPTDVQIVEIEDPNEITVTDISQMENAIYIEPAEGGMGDVVPLEVQLKNSIAPVGCSFKLTLPEHFTLAKDEDGDIIYELGNRASKMSVIMKDRNNGSYDFALTPSTETANISGNDGTIITFRVQVPDDAVVDQNYGILLTNSLVQDKQDGATQETPLSDVRTTFLVYDYIPGDMNGDGNISVTDVSGLVGAQCVLPISMSNTESIKGIQFDLRLPDGVTVATNEYDEPMFTLTSRAHSSHTVSASRLSGNHYRVVVSSLSAKTFKDTEGVIMNVTLNVDKNLSIGDYGVNLFSIVLNTADNVSIMPNDVTATLSLSDVAPGDVNGDGNINVTDVGMVIDHILEHTPSGFIAEAADVNGDGEINVTDVGLIIDIILSDNSAREVLMIEDTWDVIEPQ